MVKITVISDTHNREPQLPGGDILIHAGDLTKNGFRVEVIKQLNYLHEQLDKYTYVLLTPGNHDLFAERHLQEFREACDAAQLILLLKTGIELEGISFWGAPHTPFYHDWAFNLLAGPRADLWEEVPVNTDFLITHTPPQGILDTTHDGKLIGCEYLTTRVKEINPLVHAFGHCHKPGTLVQGPTTFVNAATAVINLEVDPVKRLVVVK